MNPFKSVLPHHGKKLQLAACGIAALLFLTLTVSAKITDGNYVGINNETGGNTDPTYADSNIATDQRIGWNVIRMGVGVSGGTTAGSPIDYTARDVVVNKYVAAGIAIHGDCGPRFNVVRDPNYATWEANWTYYCQQVFAHYKGKIFYYIIDNEPDKPVNGQYLTAQQCFDMTKIAYTTAKSIDSRIMIESPPTNTPYSATLDGMIQLNIGSVCDYIGVHVYSSQIDDGRFNGVWSSLTKWNTTRKPVMASECGVEADWAPAGIAQMDWVTRFQEQWYLAMKRYGLAGGLLFDMNDGPAGWNYYDPSFVTTYPPLENEILNNAFRTNAISNGGFESANDPQHGWIVYFSAAAASAPTWATFLTNQSSGAHSGTGYLKFDTSATTPTGQWIVVREIAQQLPLNAIQTLSAWVYINGGGTARLKAQGYNALAGDEEQIATTTTAGSWQQLTVQFTPTNPWVVIELDATGTGHAGDYMKWDDVTMQGYYNLICKKSNLALDNGNSTSISTPMVQYTPQAGNINQQWLLVDVGNGYYNLICRKSGMALDNGNSTSNSTPVVQYTPQAGNINQQWQLVDLGNGYNNVICKKSGKALDNGGSTAISATMVQYTVGSGNINQEWEIVPAN